MNRSRVSKRAHPNAAGFAATAVACHTKRQATGRKSSGLAVMVPWRGSREMGQRSLHSRAVPLPDVQTAQTRFSPRISRKPQGRHLP